MVMNHYQVIIVGGGQAGLSASYCLKKEQINQARELFAPAVRAQLV